LRRVDIPALCAALWTAVAAHTGARADDRSAPTPKAVIYPGEIITDDRLEDRTIAPEEGIATKIILSRQELIGKVARRTLLPGDTISLASVDNPRLVKIGANVRIIFIEGGLQITATGVAQQAGALGDMIRVRNQDSGLFVAGQVQADGSVQVGDGG
jgi:flagella basal body P-ring formation protein FlgA